MLNADGTMNISSLGAWTLAIRPKTLPASISPVILGTALAISDGVWRIGPALAAMAGALLMQIGVNLANDYFDWAKGVDTPDRLGPLRVTQQGLISPERVRLGILVTFLLSAAVGAYLVRVGGWPILVIGVASILSALAYSGGPYPIASHGLGELFVFVFFGLVAVCGTYYVQTLHLTGTVFSFSLPVGFLITAILVVNNLRDIATDRRVGKNTMAVLLGEGGTRLEFIILLLMAYGVPIFLWVSGRAPVGVLLVIITVPMAVKLSRRIWRGEGASLNIARAGTANLTLAFSLILSLGLIL
jgi:1,4-dihydroxy-2-naphthoate octaprenyltransferase